MKSHLLIAAVVIGHFGPIGEWFPKSTVILEIRSCEGGLESIYSDKDLTMAMANPFFVGQNGDYFYFSSDARDNIRVTVDGKYRGTIENCPYEKMERHGKN